MSRTSGPWRVIRRANQLGTRSVFVVGGPLTGNKLIVKFDNPSEEQQANACFIAAADKLLRAAKSLENWLSAPQSDLANRRIVEDCRAELRAAIREAEEGCA